MALLTRSAEDPEPNSDLFASFFPVEQGCGAESGSDQKFGDRDFANVVTLMIALRRQLDEYIGCREG
jgi:hypothetical protein